MASEREFKVLVQRRAGYRSAATKQLNAVGTTLSSIASNNIADAHVTLKRLKQLQQDMRESDVHIHGSIQDEQLEADITTALEYDEKVSTAMATLEYRLSAFESTHQTSQSGAVPTQQANQRSGGSAKPKLPTLELTSFDGDPLMWESFWDDFSSSVDGRSDICTIDKFKLLRNVLKGDALRIANGYMLTIANYEAVKSDLKQRYDDKQVAVFAHFEKLLSIDSASHDMVELRKVHDQCETHIRSLVALGLEENTFGQVFVPIVLSKFPKYVKMELHRRNGSKPWSLAQLRSHLNDEIRARDMTERMQATHTEPTHQHRINKPKVAQASNSTLIAQSGYASNRPVVSVTPDTHAQRCCYCSGNHASWKCRTCPDYDSRLAKLGNKCKSCHADGHYMRSCPQRNPCFYCQRNDHNPSLCIKKFGRNAVREHSALSTLTTQHPEETPESGSEEALAIAESPALATADSAGVASTVQRRGGQAVMKTALTYVSATKEGHAAQFLFDDGSTMSFISSNLVERLGAKPVECDSSAIGRFGDNQRSVVQWKIYEIWINLPNGSRKKMRLREIQHITAPVQLVPLGTNERAFLQQLPLAQPLVQQPQLVQIDILVGLDYYYELLGTEHRRVGGLVMLDSILGFVVSGFARNLPGGISQVGNNHMTNLVISKPVQTELERFDLERFWRIEEIGIRDDAKKTDDDLAQEHFDKTVRVVDGRYEVKWPYKVDSPELSDTFGLAFGRLRSLIRRCDQEQPIVDAYEQTFAAQLEMGIIEEAPQEPQGPVFYLPHHPVIKPQSSTTKVRIVYDASAKARKDEVSLNDCILRGPVIMPHLLGTLLRFRTYAIATVSDVEKAFHMVGLAPEDRDVTRFLWVRDRSKPLSVSNLIIYRFSRVIFGAIASSFLLAAVIMYHLKLHDTQNSRMVRDNTYVDNVIGGGSTLQAATEYYKEIKQLFSSASMNLREWFTNSQELRNLISDADKGKGETTSVLGVKWNVESDRLSCVVGKAGLSSSSTKRQVLTAIASIFDPCGWFAPVSVKCRILMQEIWRQQCTWDDMLPDCLLAQWQEIQPSLRQMPEKTMLRYISHVDQQGSRFQLHGFADASRMAYAAAVYLIVQSNGGNPHCHLLCAKARVSPLKEISIPRLELLAVLICSRLLRFVVEQLCVSFDRKVLWSDSKCALSWVLSQKSHSVFVDNRVREIRTDPKIEFRYVPTADNPADLPSRGAGCQAVMENEKWWTGPNWLCSDESSWPPREFAVHSVDAEVPEGSLNEVLNVGTSCIQAADVFPDDPAFNLAHFGSLRKLLRVTARLFRLARHGSYTIAARHEHDATEFWIKRVQSQSYGHLAVLKGQGRSSNFEKQLSLYEDDRGFVRCRGRIEYADLSTDATDPLLLPPKHPFTELVIRATHCSLFHAGVKHVLSKVREKYWVPRARTQIKAVVRDCRLCRLYKGGNFQVPKIPSLPAFRITATRPFACVGIDYAGPLIVKTEENGQAVESKAWICLITCAATRAIHLEVVANMSVVQFVLALRRFVALHGTPHMIVSDNAKQFRPADRALKKLWKEVIEHKDAQEFVTSKGIEWKFIPEFGPWFGGFYERLVAPVKGALNVALDKRCALFIELQTICYEISAVLNSRPLVYSEAQVGDTALTPSHFLLKNVDQIPDFDLNEFVDNFQTQPPSMKDTVEAFKKRQKALNAFWQCWRNQYLLSLREQTKQIRNRGASELKPEVGQVVIIKDFLPRGRWRIARISKLVVGMDGNCRSAELQLPNMNKIVRPIRNLYPLESSVLAERTLPVRRFPQNQTLRARRAAAVAADRRNKLILENEESD